MWQLAPCLILTVMISAIFALFCGAASFWLPLGWHRVCLSPKTAGQVAKRSTWVDCWGKKGFRAKWKEELTATKKKGRKYLPTASAQKTVNTLTIWINPCTSGSHLKPDQSSVIRQVQKWLLPRIPENCHRRKQEKSLAPWKSREVLLLFNEIKPCSEKPLCLPSIASRWLSTLILWPFQVRLTRS